MPKIIQHMTIEKLKLIFYLKLNWVPAAKETISYLTYSLCKSLGCFRVFSVDSRWRFNLGKSKQKINFIIFSAHSIYWVFLPAVLRQMHQITLELAFQLFSCLNIIDQYKMARFFRNSVIDYYFAMLSRHKALQIISMWELVLNIFIPEEIECIPKSSHTTANFDPYKSHSKLQKKSSTLNNWYSLNWKY